MISKAGIRDNVSQRYYEFKVLKIEDLFTFEINKIKHQLTHKKTPNNFNTCFSYTTNILSRLTRQTSNNNIFLPSFRNLRCQPALKYFELNIWNDIPLKIKNSSFLKFKELFNSI